MRQKNWDGRSKSTIYERSKCVAPILSHLCIRDYHTLLYCCEAQFSNKIQMKVSNLIKRNYYAQVVILTLVCTLQQQTFQYIIYEKSKCVASILSYWCIRDYHTFLYCCKAQFSNMIQTRVSNLIKRNCYVQVIFMLVYTL